MLMLVKPVPQQASPHLHLGRRAHDADPQVSRSELHRTSEVFDYRGKLFTVYVQRATGARFVYLGEPHYTKLHRIYRA